MTFFVNRIFVKMTSYWIRLGPNPNDRCPYTEGNLETHTHTNRGKEPEMGAMQ